MRAVDETGGSRDLVVPVLAAVESALSEELADLVAHAHAHDALVALGPRRHGLQAREPLVRLEEPRVIIVVTGRLGPPPVAVVEVAAPRGPADVVVQDGHDALAPERIHHLGVCVDDACRLEPGVLADGRVIHVAHALRRHTRSRGRSTEGVADHEARVEGHVGRVGQAHAVEARVGDPLGQEVDRLLVEALRDVYLHVPAPVDALELDTLVFGVYDPST